MGAGASLDAAGHAGGGGGVRGEAGSGRYYCHECRRSFLPNNSQLECVFCRSSFLEELENVPGEQEGEDGGGGGGGGGGRMRQYELNEEQTRRLTSAAALLQMLEVQLRDELEMLQTSLVLRGRGQGQGEDEGLVLGGQGQDKPPAFTQGMKDLLKNVKTSVDMICEQPR
jgi:hypothetical protein